MLLLVLAAVATGAWRLLLVLDDVTPVTKDDGSVLWMGGMATGAGGIGAGLGRACFSVHSRAVLSCNFRLRIYCVAIDGTDGRENEVYDCLEWLLSLTKRVLCHAVCN